MLEKLIVILFILPFTLGCGLITKPQFNKNELKIIKDYNLHYNIKLSKAVLCKEYSRVEYLWIDVTSLSDYMQVHFYTRTPRGKKAWFCDIFYGGKIRVTVRELPEMYILSTAMHYLIRKDELNKKGEYGKWKKSLFKDQKDFKYLEYYFKKEGK